MFCCNRFLKLSWVEIGRWVKMCGFPPSFWCRASCRLERLKGFWWSRVLHGAEMERQHWDMTHMHSFSHHVTTKFVCWRVSGWWFLVSLHSYPLTKSLVPLCPRLYLNVSVLLLNLVVISERTKINVRCLGLFLLLSLWAAVVFVHLLPFHWFLLWSLQLQLDIKNAFNLQLLWSCTIGK